ncbi:uncharacterized protein DSM5745_09769 [Aspergillus mulundensis]|uniref:Transcription factor domain-containing protein n=1 Tax=Aspergillus mulundensis TaxID=1810919 RepID=A0A3D8QRQ5_9EURO|nr:Uncharacterized protein DSM5745_09769 [Aspergillus mulundensis]RDW64358.1 Uncharacterized protein DSM5745_09769 [Aspergillus mulundensis]
MAADFQFISIQVNDDAKDRAARRQARSHAVKKALEKKRKRQQLARNNFIVTTLEDRGGSVEFGLSQSVARKAPISGQISNGLDPFETLAVDSSRLQILLADYRARQAPEPVFSMAEELAFQSFRSVFKTGFDDPALANAVMLSLSFAVTGGSIDQECLRYQGQAITYIREQMDAVDEAASEATIGAILLIAGVAARLGLKAQVELHMSAVHQLLKICRSKSIYLTAGIKRAIFWQDLNASILANSKRIVDHATFAELLWARDPFVPSHYHLPLGFKSRAYILGVEFCAVLQDLHALQCIRDRPRPARTDAMQMLHINNHTASVQSRLVALSGLSPLQKCCRLAAYLCSVTLCCKVWCELVIPSHISSELLLNLQQTCDSLVWNEHPDLLLWLLYVGGAFAPVGPVRSGYLDLLRLKSDDDYSSWPKVHECMRRFIWSDNAFLVPVRALSREVSQYCSFEEGRTCVERK